MRSAGAKDRSSENNQDQNTAERLPVSRWLRIGAASAGLGAALLGYSLLGPSTGTASADGTADPSASSQSSASNRSDSDAPRRTPRTARAESVAAPRGGDRDDANEGVSSTTEKQDTHRHAPGDDKATQESPNDEAAEDVPDEPAEEPTDEPPPQPPLLPAPPAAKPAAAPPWLARQPSWDEVVGFIVSDLTEASHEWIDALPVDDQVKSNLGATVWAVRRTFFNQAPTVDPVQISGQLEGPITGRIGAVDADGDTVVYRVTKAPEEGELVLDSDGTYVYLPGDDFDGVDSFDVVAVDSGWHVNLLNPLRPEGTAAQSWINYRAVTFEFTYDDDDIGWTEERRQALQRVAEELAAQFVVKAPVTLTYFVLPDAGEGLAAAGSNLVSNAPGYWRTVVQDKLISGVDANGDDYDGAIGWDWTEPWELGDDVDSTEFDFTSVARHEVLHSFGFISAIRQPGANEGNRDWVVFDRFVVTIEGVHPISPFYRWMSYDDSKLIRQDGGLYFGGPNAIAAYGGLVPLLTVEPWEPGSSLNHLDDFTFRRPERKVMNAYTQPGPRVRELSPVEIGILRDLGYHVLDVAPSAVEHAPQQLDQRARLVALH